MGRKVGTDEVFMRMTNYTHFLVFTVVPGPPYMYNRRDMDLK